MRQNEMSTEEKDRHDRYLGMAKGGGEAANKLIDAAEDMQAGPLVFGLLYLAGCVMADLPGSIEERRETLEIMVRMLRGFFEDALLEVESKSRH